VCVCVCSEEESEDSSSEEEEESDEEEKEVGLVGKKRKAPQETPAKKAKMENGEKTSDGESE